LLGGSRRVHDRLGRAVLRSLSPRDRARAPRSRGDYSFVRDGLAPHSRSADRTDTRRSAHLLSEAHGAPSASGYGRAVALQPQERLPHPRSEGDAGVARARDGTTEPSGYRASTAMGAFRVPAAASRARRGRCGRRAPRSGDHASTTLRTPRRAFLPEDAVLGAWSSFVRWNLGQVLVRQCGGIFGLQTLHFAL